MRAMAFPLSSHLYHRRLGTLSLLLSVWLLLWVSTSNILLRYSQLTPNSDDAYHESLEENHWRGQRKDWNVSNPFHRYSSNTNPENRFMTANRTVRTGLTASAVISVSYSPSTAWIPTDKRLFSVLALVNRFARLIFCRLRLWCSRSILVCSWLQSNDCVLRALGNILQAKNPGSAYFAGGCSDSIW